MAEVAIEKRFEIEVRDLEYQRMDGVPLLARLYRPIRPGNSGGSFPAVIDVHGGAWASGDRLNNAPLDEALAKSGIVVLAIDFRMPPQHRYPASIADVNLATRWLKNHAEEFGSRRELVGGLGTSSGAHQLLLSALRPADPRYAALPLAEAPSEDAGLPYLVLCWPIADPLARYQMVREKGNTRLVEAHDAWWPSQADMVEGNPQAILERGETGACRRRSSCKALPTTMSPRTWPTALPPPIAPAADASSYTNSPASRTPSSCATRLRMRRARRPS